MINPILSKGVRPRQTSLPSFGYSLWSLSCQSCDLQTLGEVILEGRLKVVVW